MLSRHPPSHRNQAQPAQTLALDTECLERHPIWSAGDLQIVLVLERSQRSSSLWPHAAVNRDFSTIGIECRLDAFNGPMVRHALLHRCGRLCSRLRRRFSGRRGRRRWRSGGGLALTRCTAGERTGNHDSHNDAKAMLSCDHGGHPFRCRAHETSRSLPVQAKAVRSVSKHEWL